MANRFFSERNLRFLLNEVFDLEALTRYPRYDKHNRKVFDLILKEANSLAKDLLFPIVREMDEEPPRLENGRVLVHPRVRAIMKEFGEGGWISAMFPERFDGGELPSLLYTACRFVFAAANYSGAVYPELSAGAANLIVSFGSEELKETYVPKMLEGKWQGTMALTEPQAGSSLTDITTTAYPREEGTYRIQGHKIFISAGDHDGVDNVVHLMLAKIEGAPPGVKGISLFVVPRLLPGPDGELVNNNIQVAAVYHKLGYRGCPITELAIGEKGETTGFLVGEANRGLIHMFQMMNEARIGVGLGACAVASAAYHASLEYARERPQGRHLTQKDPAIPQIPIIEHADIKRMLLFQRGVVEGALSLILAAARYEDLSHAAEGEEKEKAALLLDLLTPVVKSFPSEYGVLSTSAAIQCLGGYGYCEDFPVEQYYRDVRIHPIHEGTTGIQAMDLLGRKVVMHEGRALRLFVEEVEKVLDEAREYPEIADRADMLAKALKTLTRVTMHLGGVAMEKGAQVFLADATLYLELFSLVAVAWQWLIQAIAAQKALAGNPGSADKAFYQGKLFAFRYFFAYELVKIEGLAARLSDTDTVTLNMAPEHFTD